MTDFVDLEIGLRRDGDHYAVELRSSLPGWDMEVRSGYARVQLDVAELEERSLDDAGYGQYLTESLFAAPAVEPEPPPPEVGQTPEMIFYEARSLAQERHIPLRVRLFIGPNAPELHNLCWEKLCDPRDGTPLLTDENVPFSRYLSSMDWGHVSLRRKTDLSALVVVANPDLSNYPHLAPINVRGELDHLGPSLDGMSVTLLASEGTEELVPKGKATVANIKTHLRDGYDILYLVCHGTVEGFEPTLWLEGEDGRVEHVSGNRLVSDLSKLPVLPRLVVLASCQSAGSGTETHASQRRALSALGPRLGEACIPAVLAMQGNVAMGTIAEFMPVFFRELRRDGQIDRAVAAARSQVRDTSPESDWWRPALFMRLKSGRIWYTPGFASEEHEIKTWPPLLRAIEGDEEEHLFCTPILGPGLANCLFGSHREMARHWAETYQFPMAQYYQEDLSQVAQYLAVHWQDPHLRSELRAHLRQELLDRYGKDLLSYYADALPKKLHELIQAVGKLGPECRPLDLYHILAKLPFRIYVSTDPTNLLETVLTSVGRPPQPIVCPWREGIDPVYYEGPFTLSSERPLLYYPFGSLQVPPSLVLTEDDFYDFLIRMTENRSLIPPVVLDALASNALLFLGFQIEERGFRVLIRSIMNLKGRRRDVSSVAAQVFPEEGYVREPERARRYLERYFETAQINIYWGSVEDFIGELERRWREREGEL
jgi:hypothetical protein